MSVLWFDLSLLKGITEYFSSQEMNLCIYVNIFDMKNVLTKNYNLINFALMNETKTKLVNQGEKNGSCN